MGQLVCCLAVRNRHLSEKRSLTQLGKEAERKSRKTKTEERAERKSRKTKTEESADRMNRGRSLDRRINAGYNDNVSMAGTFQAGEEGRAVCRSEPHAEKQWDAAGIFGISEAGKLAVRNMGKTS